MLKRLLQVLLVLVGLVVVAAAVFSVYVMLTWNRTYDAPLPAVTISTDPAVLARGEYLTYGPAHCVECHGGADSLQRLAEGEKVPLAGGQRFALGPLGAVYAKNLTPDTETGLGRYSDAQVARMMRWAVKPDGHATIEPMMPFGNMSDDDLTAVISYLRTQTPVKNAVPESEWTVMGKVIRTVASTFKPRTTINPPATAPAEAPTKDRGEYIARYVSNCVGCHTPRDPMSFAAIGPEFSGGFEMEPIAAPGVDPATWFRTPNITPAKDGALAKFPDRATFIARFKNGGRHYPGSAMPWEAFAMMTEADLGGLWEFLNSLPASPGPTGEPTFKPTDD